MDINLDDIDVEIEETEKQKREKLMEIAIEKAKRMVEIDYRCKPEERNWNETEVGSDHEKSSYRIKLFLLDGSPPKGYVIADYAYGLVRMFGCCGKEKTLGTIKAFPIGQYPAR